MRQLSPIADEEGNVFLRPSRMGLWTGGIEQLEHPATRLALAPYSGDLTGLYRLYECSGSLIYIGIPNDPMRRWKQHAASKDWWYEVDLIMLAPFGSADTAPAAERYAIRGERPLYNVQHGTWRNDR